jgi:shikimate dehydrogenase
MLVCFGSMSNDRVHTLADLDTWRFDGVALAVLGKPVAHSLSPAMHNAALADLATRETAFARWRYFKFEIDPSDLRTALPRFHARGFFGLNLTIPHKIIAVDLVRRIDPAAAEAGAVNTLRRLDEGYEGFNTDGYGVSRAVSDDLEVTIAGSPVILLGAGGAARAAAVMALREGCTALWIGNRTASSLIELVRTLVPIAARTKIKLRGFDLGNPPADLPADALVINATSVGLKTDDQPPIDLSKVPGQPRVYDMIYNPPETPLLRAAKARGLRAANGLTMLVHQGARALEIWSERPVAAAIMHAACQSALAAADPRG